MTTDTLKAFTVKKNAVRRHVDPQGHIEIEGGGWIAEFADGKTFTGASREVVARMARIHAEELSEQW
jgi:hypothetical protein